MEKQDNKVKITLRYDGGAEKVTLLVDSDELEVCLEQDYQVRLKNAKSGEEVKKNTPQEFARSLDRESYNSWHKLNRHVRESAKSLDTDVKGIVNPIDLVADTTVEEEMEVREQKDMIHHMFYDNLPKKYADLLWTVIIEEIPIEEIAKSEGVTARAIYLRYETAKKYFKKYFPNPSLF